MVSAPYQKDAGTNLQKVDQFLGQYGNFAYGNVTVVVDDITQELVLNFDSFTCAVTNVTERRDACLGVGIYWFLGLFKVEFDEASDPSQFVDVTFVVTEPPVRFERGLLFEDAPGPTDHWPQCEEVFPNKN